MVLLVGVLSTALACGKIEAEPGSSDDGGADGQTCTHGGMTYPIGAQFPMGDGCNGCICQAGGAVGCTTRGCDAPLPPPPSRDAGVPERPPPMLFVDGALCTVTKHELARGQPPDGHVWSFLAEATCPTLGGVTLDASGYDDRGYPLDCAGAGRKGVATVSFQVAADDAGVYRAASPAGSCKITSGPAVAGGFEPYTYATVVRDGDSRVIRYAP